MTSSSSFFHCAHFLFLLTECRSFTRFFNSLKSSSSAASILSSRSSARESSESKPSSSWHSPSVPDFAFLFLPLSSLERTCSAKSWSPTWRASWFTKFARESFFGFSMPRKVATRQRSPKVSPNEKFRSMALTEGSHWVATAEMPTSVSTGKASDPSCWSHRVVKYHSSPPGRTNCNVPSSSLLRGHTSKPHLRLAATMKILSFTGSPSKENFGRNTMPGRRTTQARASSARSTVTKRIRPGHHLFHWCLKRKKPNQTMKTSLSWESRSAESDAASGFCLWRPVATAMLPLILPAHLQTMKAMSSLPWSLSRTTEASQPVSWRSLLVWASWFFSIVSWKSIFRVWQCEEFLGFQTFHCWWAHSGSALGFVSYWHWPKHLFSPSGANPLWIWYRASCEARMPKAHAHVWLCHTQNTETPTSWAQKLCIEYPLPNLVQDWIAQPGTEAASLPSRIALRDQQQRLRLEGRQQSIREGRQACSKHCRALTAHSKSGTTTVWQMSLELGHALRQTRGGVEKGHDTAEACRILTEPKEHRPNRSTLYIASTSHQSTCQPVWLALGWDFWPPQQFHCSGSNTAVLWAARLGPQTRWTTHNMLRPGGGHPCLPSVDWMTWRQRLACHLGSGTLITCVWRRTRGGIQRNFGANWTISPIWLEIASDWSYQVHTSNPTTLWFPHCLPPPSHRTSQGWSSPHRTWTAHRPRNVIQVFLFQHSQSEVLNLTILITKCWAKSNPLKIAVLWFCQQKVFQKLVFRRCESTRAIWPIVQRP